ncbi:hypothetical protein [Microbacterium sp. NPDC090003]|uniref:hypothetical protein n=1 Tax=Microbacterium sp. NPDC090003 TaxID=3364203 RepID=UPI003816202C
MLHTRVVAEFGDAPTELREFLTTALGARWSDGGQEFDVAFRYAETASNHVKLAGRVATFRALSPAVPLEALIAEAVRVAKERESWEVTAVEVLSETVGGTIEEGFDRLVFRASCVARVTQTPTPVA